MPMLVHVPEEVLDVEPEVRCIAGEVLELELVLVREEHGVHSQKRPWAPAAAAAAAASSACGWTSGSGRCRKT
ncbi:hypothetical protein [Georgenia sp. AZ-5]|uniref:hypothetical protein n=1 Tax=Georgenia sp. AZ-5 TaxID=3367526 RepID=UPI0037550F85